MESKNLKEKKAENLLQEINQVVSELEKDPDMKKEVEAMHKVFMKLSQIKSQKNGR